MAEAHELDLAGWVDHLDHSASLSIEDHPIALVPAVSPAQDANGIGVYLGEDWVTPRCEVWDVDQLPCLCAHP